MRFDELAPEIVSVHVAAREVHLGAARDVLEMGEEKDAHIYLPVRMSLPAAIHSTPASARRKVAVGQRFTLK